MSNKDRNEELEDILRSPDFLTRVQNREPRLVESLVRSYTENLFKGALGLGFDSTNAEELVQNVWVTFFDVAPNFQGRSHVKTFIFAILFNRASELRRERKKTENVESIDDLVANRFMENGSWSRPPISPLQFLESTETLNLIQKCIDALPLNQRMAFCLKEIDDHGTHDICNILGVTVTNLGVLLYRAKNRLRECIEFKADSKRG